MTDPYKALGLNPLNTYDKPQVQQRINALKRANEIKYSPEELARFEAEITSGMAADESLAAMKKDFSRVLRSFIFVRTDGKQVILDKSADAICKKMKNKGWNIEKDDIDDLTKTPIEKCKDYALNAKLVGALGAMECKPFVEWTNDAVDTANGYGGNVDKLGPKFDASEVRAIYAALNKIFDVLMEQRKCMDLVKAFRKVKPCVDDDKLLEDLKTWSVLWEIVEDIKASSSDRIERSTIEALFESNGFARSGADTDKSLKALEQYCMSMGIIANLSKDDDFDLKCGSCGAYMPKDNEKCTVCGSDLYYHCKCGATTPFSEGKCKRCGMGIALVSDIKETQKKVEKLTASYGLAELRRLLNDLGEHKKNLDPLVLARAEAVLRDNDAIVSKLDSLISASKINEALEASKRYLAGKPNSPDLEQVRLRKSHCESTMAEVRRRLQDAGTLSGKDAAKEYAAIMRLCADCPEANARLEGLRPQKPSSVMLSESMDGFIRIRMAQADGKPAGYEIVKNAGRAPRNREDGETIKTAASEYVDRDIVFGKGYYYAVYSERNGISSSEPTYAGPFAVFSNVRNLRASSETKGIRLRFDVPKGCSRVWMCRSEGSVPASLGMGRVDLGIEGGYLDVESSGEGMSYGYLLVAEYSDGRSTPAFSKGISVVCTYEKVPEPPGNFKVQPKGNGTFSAAWNQCREECRLYSSPKRIGGNKTATADYVRKNMSPLSFETTGQNSASFSLPPGAVLYVYPVVISGSNAAIGAEKLVHNAIPPGNVRCVYSGGRYVVTLDWPKGALAMRACYSGDGFPSDPHEGFSVRKTKQEYDAQKKIEIPSKDSEIFVAVFSEYPESTFSEGRNISCSKLKEKTAIRYSITSGLFGTKIEFSTDPALSALPEMALRVSDFGFPRPDDEKIATVSKVDLNKGRGTFVLSKEAANAYRSSKRSGLFFANFEDYEIYTLEHPRS